MKRGKKYKAVIEKYNKGEQYPLSKAIELVKELAFAKFDETVEVAIKLNIKAKHAIRDTLVLPHQFGKEKKILVFAKGEKAEEATKNGATYVGDSDIIAKIKKGWLDFDVAVATPDMMKEVGKLGPILGRKGLMPNPKTRTVSLDLKGTLAELKKGRVEYRADKGGVIHLSVGKISMANEKLGENLKSVLASVEKKKPADVKGVFINSVAICSTMGPGVKLSFKELN